MPATTDVRRDQTEPIAELQRAAPDRAAIASTSAPYGIRSSVPRAPSRARSLEQIAARRDDRGARLERPARHAPDRTRSARRRRRPIRAG